MPELKPLPVALTGIPFTNETARRRGVGAERLRSRDLVAPLHGVHAQHPDAAQRPHEPPNGGGETRAAIERCRAFAVLLRPGERFSHTTAALLWGAALPRSAVTAPLHVSVPDPARARRARGVVGHTIGGAPARSRLGMPSTGAVCRFPKSTLRFWMPQAGA